jgi:hypothetical protein
MLMGLTAEVFSMTLKSSLSIVDGGLGTGELLGVKEIWLSPRTRPSVVLTSSPFSVGMMGQLTMKEAAFGQSAAWPRL